MITTSKIVNPKVETPAHDGILYKGIATGAIYLKITGGYVCLVQGLSPTVFGKLYLNQLSSDFFPFFGTIEITNL